jgi:hypothetical protein
VTVAAMDGMRADRLRFVPVPTDEGAAGEPGPDAGGER